MDTSDIQGLDVSLRKFDINKMRDDSNVIIIGKRETGKTYLTNDLLKNFSVPEGTIISPTEIITSSSYSKTVPQASIHTLYDSSIITDLVKHQRECYRNSEKIMFRKFLVLDNCFWQSLDHHPEVMGCWINNRGYKLSNILTIPYGHKLSLKMWSNTDYIFLLRENIVSNRKRIYDYYTGMFPTFELFCNVLDKYTKDYTCLVIDNTRWDDGARIEDHVFWYKSP